MEGHDCQIMDEAKSNQKFQKKKICHIHEPYEGPNRIFSMLLGLIRMSI